MKKESLKTKQVKAHLHEFRVFVDIKHHSETVNTVSWFFLPLLKTVSVYTECNKRVIIFVWLLCLGNYL